jgi:hypothetical protein
MLTTKVAASPHIEHHLSLNKQARKKENDFMTLVTCLCGVAASLPSTASFVYVHS